MQHSTLYKAAILALASLGAGAATAQSSVTIYGNIDIALESHSKGAGDVAGTIWPASSSVAAETHMVAVTSSVSSVNQIGVKGTEDIGGGYKANFVLEGQMQPDTGAQSGQDSRMWGRQAYLGLTTPVGEIRLGRQYAPMFFSFATTTVEALGGADLQGFGLIVNNLQIRQDNQISYWLKTGGLTAALSYSPQAGVDQKVSSSRGQAAGAAGGQILGGATAGGETSGSGGRGQTIGLFAHYAFDNGLSVTGSYHMNKFGDAVAYSAAAASLTPSGVLFNLDKYTGWALGTKYVIPGLGTQLSGLYHDGKYEMDDGGSIKTSTVGLGVKHPIGDFAIGAQYTLSKFTNFTKGKDQAVILIGDYNLSKRTKIYTRFGFAKDDRGNEANTANPYLNGAGVGVVGGPLPVLTGFGAQETPFFSGAGANVGDTTRFFAVGIRHMF